MIKFQNLLCLLGIIRSNFTKFNWSSSSSLWDLAVHTNIIEHIFAVLASLNTLLPYPDSGYLKGGWGEINKTRRRTVPASVRYSPLHRDNYGEGAGQPNNLRRSCRNDKTHASLQFNLSCYRSPSLFLPLSLSLSLPSLTITTTKCWWHKL